MPKHNSRDNVNSPAHYRTGGIETWDYIKAKLTPEELRGYLKGNILKYVSRAESKNAGDTAIEDYLKSKWYMDRLAEQCGETES